jgi:hypothetical protein
VRQPSGALPLAGCGLLMTMNRMNTQPYVIHAEFGVLYTAVARWCAGRSLLLVLWRLVGTVFVVVAYLGLLGASCTVPLLPFGVAFAVLRCFKAISPAVYLLAGSGIALLGVIFASATGVAIYRELKIHRVNVDFIVMECGFAIVVILGAILLLVGGIK